MRREKTQSFKYTFETCANVSQITHNLDFKDTKHAMVELGKGYWIVDYLFYLSFANQFLFIYWFCFYNFKAF